jgi:hypothetical protein
MQLTDYTPKPLPIVIGCGAFVFALLAFLYGLATDADMTDIGALSLMAVIYGVVSIWMDYRRWQRSVGAPIPGGPHVLAVARKIGWWGGGVILVSFVILILSDIYAQNFYILAICVAGLLIGTLTAMSPFFVWWAGIFGLIRLD